MEMLFLNKGKLFLNKGKTWTLKGVPKADDLIRLSAGNVGKVARDVRASTRPSDSSVTRLDVGQSDGGPKRPPVRPCHVIISDGLTLKQRNVRYKYDFCAVRVLVRSRRRSSRSCDTPL